MIIKPESKDNNVHKISDGAKNTITYSMSAVMFGMEVMLFSEKRE